MKIRVKLFGTLGQDFPGYDSLNGMDVNIPDDARVKDLLAHLDIPKTRDYFVTMGKTVDRLTGKLINYVTVLIFQALAGG